MKRIPVFSCALLLAFAAQAQLRNNPTPSTAFPRHLTVVNPDIPSEMTFAGTQISLDRIDMAERFDREFTSLIYGQTNTLLTFKRANRYFPVIAPILKEQGIPSDFLYLACVESLLDYNAYSSAKAAGMWQLLAETGRQYGLEVNDEVDERYDPERSTRAACKYLKAAYSRYGHWPTVAASYNAGMTRITNELAKQQVDNSFDLYLVSETSRYVFRIMGTKLLMENPTAYGYNLRRSQLYQPIEYTVVEVDTAVASWAEWAQQHNLTYAQLRDANPWIRAAKLTNKNGKTYKVRIPKREYLSRTTCPVRIYNRKWVVD